jgi:HlyD family secretion protein
MNGSRLWLGAALLIVAIGIGAATLMRGSKKTGEAVRVAVVEQRTITQKVLAQGKVRARSQVEVASEIGGRISAVHVKVGDVVKTGDPLFELDAEQLRNAVEQLRVALAGAEALKKRAELGVAEADRGVARDQALRDKNVVAEEQLKLSSSRAELARAELEQANAGLERTRLDLQRARDALRRAKVAAPRDGTVVAVGVEVGQVVSAVAGLAGTEGLGGFGFASPTASPGAPVILADLAELIVKLDVDELDIGLVKEGQQVSIEAQGLKDVKLRGTVERVGLIGREQGGAVLFAVEIGVDQGPGHALLRPGMSAQADIEVQKLENVLAVPVAAVLEGDGDKKPDRVFRYDGDDVGGRVVETNVKLGPTEGDAIAILDGLKKDQQVVAGPFRALKSLADGDKVVVEKERADAGP